MQPTQPLDVAFNVAVRQIADRLYPTGFDIGPNAPETLEAMNAHIAKTGRMLVSDANSNQTIFACADTNFAFRAWHDWHHWKLQAPFNLIGEAQVARAMYRDVVTLFGEKPDWADIITAEVVGQAAHFHNTGEFVVDQMAFTRDYIAKLQANRGA